jgi:hypothetical protein
MGRIIFRSDHRQAVVGKALLQLDPRFPEAQQALHHPKSRFSANCAAH